MNLAGILSLISLILQAAPEDIQAIIAIVDAIRGASPQHQAAVATALTTIAPPKA